LKWIKRVHNQITGRDTKGRITDLSEIIQGTAKDKHYDYDSADRLWRVYENGALLKEYGYDLNGNRTHVNGTLVGVYDDRDRLNTYDGTSYAYYDSGELATKTQGPSATRYSHDAFNKMNKAIAVRLKKLPAYVLKSIHRSLILSALH